MEGNLAASDLHHRREETRSVTPLCAEPLPQDGLAQIWIPEHVFVCTTPDGVVFLDIRQDKYIGLDIGVARALCSLVHDWPLSRTDAGSDATEESQGLVTVAELVGAGLLTHDRSHMNRKATAIVDRSTVLNGVGFGTEANYAIRVAHVAVFLAALLSAAGALRFHSLEHVVQQVTARKEAGQRSTGRFDIEKATELVSIFRRIRHYFFSGKGRCLLHALTLINFLARYNLYPTWVMGVMTTPWAAHSWVEQDCYVLDGTPEKILSYTPILTI